MKKQYKQYDPAYKMEVCKQIVNGQNTVAAMSRETGITENTLYIWLKKYKESKDTPFVGSGNILPENEEVIKLRRQVKDLSEEVEILKKAAAYFAKNQK